MFLVFSKWLEKVTNSLTPSRGCAKGALLDITPKSMSSMLIVVPILFYQWGHKTDISQHHIAYRISKGVIQPASGASHMESESDLATPLECKGTQARQLSFQYLYHMRKGHA